MATAPVTAIADPEAYAEFLETSEAKLLVIDCHQDWCGPCETVKPTFNAIFNTIDNCAERVSFLTANLKDLTPQIAELLKTKANDLDLANHGCMPFFLIVKGKAIVYIIKGADVPTLKEVVIAQAPGPAEAE